MAALGAVSVDAPYLPWGEAEAQQLGAVGRVRVEGEELRLFFACVVVAVGLPALAVKVSLPVGNGCGVAADGRSRIAAATEIYREAYGCDDDGKYGQDGAAVAALQVEKGFHGYWVMRFLGYAVVGLWGFTVVRLWGFTVVGLLGYTVVRSLGYEVIGSCGFGVIGLYGCGGVGL